MYYAAVLKSLILCSPHSKLLSVPWKQRNQYLCINISVMDLANSQANSVCLGLNQVPTIYNRTTYHTHSKQHTANSTQQKATCTVSCQWLIINSSLKFLLWEMTSLHSPLLVKAANFDSVLRSLGIACDALPIAGEFVWCCHLLRRLRLSFPNQQCTS